MLIASYKYTQTSGHTWNEKEQKKGNEEMIWRRRGIWWEGGKWNSQTHMPNDSILCAPSDAHKQIQTHTHIECHLSLFELTEVINLVLKVFSFRQYRIFRFRLVIRVCLFMFDSVARLKNRPKCLHIHTHLCMCMMGNVDRGNDWMKNRKRREEKASETLF